MKAENTASWKPRAASESENNDWRTMMKNTKKLQLVLVTALCALLLLLSSCGGSDVPDGMKSVSPASVSFELFVPTTWVDNSQSGMASAYFSSDDRANVSMTCIVMDSELSTLEQYAVYADASLKEALPGYALIVGSTAVDSGAIASSGTVSSSAAEEPQYPAGFAACKFCGLKAFSFEYTAKTEGKEYHFRQIVTAKSTSFYVFTYTAEKENYDLHADEVNSIVENVRFK